MLLPGFTCFWTVRSVSHSRKVSRQQPARGSGSAHGPTSATSGEFLEPAKPGQTEEEIHPQLMQRLLAVSGYREAART